MRNEDNVFYDDMYKVRKDWVLMDLKHERVNVQDFPAYRNGIWDDIPFPRAVRGDDSE